GHKTERRAGREAAAGRSRPRQCEHFVMTHTEATAAAPRLADLMLEFLGHLELERGLSRNTLEAYRSDLEQYGEYLRARGFDPLEISSIELAGFVSALAEGADGRKGVAPATLQRKIACLRSFYRHLRREQML